MLFKVIEFSTNREPVCDFLLQYNTIQYKTYNAPYLTKMLFVGAGKILEINSN